MASGKIKMSKNAVILAGSFKDKIKPSHIVAHEFLSKNEAGSAEVA